MDLQKLFFELAFALSFVSAYISSLYIPVKNRQTNAQSPRPTYAIIVNYTVFSAYGVNDKFVFRDFNKLNLGWLAIAFLISNKIYFV